MLVLSVLLDDVELHWLDLHFPLIASKDCVYFSLPIFVHHSQSYSCFFSSFMTCRSPPSSSITSYRSFCVRLVSEAGYVDITIFHWSVLKYWCVNPFFAANFDSSFVGFVFILPSILQSCVLGLAVELACFILLLQLPLSFLLKDLRLDCC